MVLGSQGLPTGPLGVNLPPSRAQHPHPPLPGPTRSSLLFINSSREVSSAAPVSIFLSIPASVFRSWEEREEQQW